MLNARLVNALISYFPPPSFCETFHVFGRICDFRIPLNIRATFGLTIARPGVPSSIPYNNQCLEPNDEHINESSKDL